MKSKIGTTRYACKIIKDIYLDFFKKPVNSNVFSIVYVRVFQEKNIWLCRNRWKLSCNKTLLQDSVTSISSWILSLVLLCNACGVTGLSFSGKPCSFIRPQLIESLVIVHFCVMRDALIIINYFPVKSFVQKHEKNEETKFFSWFYSKLGKWVALLFFSK